MITKDKNDNLSIRIKVLILFVDFTLFAILLSVIETFLSIFDIKVFNTWLFMLLIYFTFFTIPEFHFNRTLGMKFFKVLVTNRKSVKFDKKFLVYSIFVILDRSFLLVFLHFFKALFHSKDNLLLSEKYSHLRWSKIKVN